MTVVSKRIVAARALVAAPARLYWRFGQREKAPRALIWTTNLARKRFIEVTMEQNAFRQIIDRLRDEGSEIRTIVFSDDMIDELTREQAEELVGLYGARTLMKLPLR
jgi:hypothetical protein